MCLSMLFIISHELNGVCASVVFDMALVKQSPPCPGSSQVKASVQGVVSR